MLIWFRKLINRSLYVSNWYQSSHSTRANGLMICNGWKCKRRRISRGIIQLSLWMSNLQWVNEKGYMSCSKMSYHSFRKCSDREARYIKIDKMVFVLAVCSGASWRSSLITIAYRSHPLSAINVSFIYIYLHTRKSMRPGEKKEGHLCEHVKEEAPLLIYYILHCSIVV